MPIVDTSGDKLVLLQGVGQNGEPQILNLSKADFVRIHEEFDGGNDIAFLDTRDG